MCHIDSIDPPPPLCKSVAMLGVFVFASLHIALAGGQVESLCDILVAGGSTAALAAATNAARFAPDLHICLTEPSDCLGGQLTSESVSAIDFGSCNDREEYQPPDFWELLESTGEGNPGICWVSIKCFLPRTAIDNWILGTVANLTNLQVFYNTVIKDVETFGREVVSVRVIQRTPRDGVDQWQSFLSEMIEDWYSFDDSNLFLKTEVLLRNPVEGSPLVVIEATEFGDILVLSNASYRQGIEVPSEDSESTLDTCGQAITIPFYMVYNYEPIDHDDKMINTSFDDYSLNNFTWDEVWSYRRSLGWDWGEPDAAKAGEISNQNWGTVGGNDYLDGYMFLSYQDSIQQKNDWYGGINLTTLTKAEERSLGYYTWYKKESEPTIYDHLSLGVEDTVGTSTGLSKMPYVRDIRRSVGLDNFRLSKQDLYGDTLQVFHDRVALGHYHYADTHPISSCSHPPYLQDNAIDPYYIPFRALTNRDLDNLLVVGKNMAQTYFANAATRLHPMEWGTGLAGGLAAVMMRREGYTTRDVYENIEELQKQIKKLMPLEWGSCETGRYL